MSQQGVAILGVFVADLGFRASRLPAIGETIIGSGFAVGPGGKGSNQAVAAARAAPAVPFDDVLYVLCDYVVPNETEAEALTGIAVSDLAAARQGERTGGRGMTRPPMRPAFVSQG
jgi:sugar/nucleoside kinase (ribokinase family)